ncbi:SOS response-associated peptidase family protein [Sediminivirga luteola]|nr:SOS response-associated peptidase family protein [Sediminivirga luteola]
MLSAAGLYTVTDEGVSCTIITTTSHDAAGQVHDRMPAFLTEDLAADWLTPGPVEGEEWARLLADSAERVADGLEVYEVDRKVNSTRSARWDDPTLIEPASNA